MKKRVPKVMLFAEEQIVLARERTTLSWLRFGIALMVGSITILHFAIGKLSYVFGASLLASGICLVGIELRELHKQKQIEKRLVKKTNI